MKLLKWIVLAFLFFMLVGYVGGYQHPDPAEFRKLAERAGFSPAATEKALRVATCESGLKPQAVGDGTLTTQKWGPSVGPFQVRTLWSDLLGDRSPILNWIPQFNAESAYKISNGGTDWGAWSCGGA
jgi:hypothetical protein